MLIMNFFTFINLNLTIMRSFQKLFSFFSGLLKINQQGRNQTSVTSDTPSTKPCILSKEQTCGMLESQIVEIYQPALIQEGVHIPLAEAKPVNFPLSEQEIAKLKQKLCYVWCDGYESKIWRPRNCKYLGIRISDSFILHETLLSSTWEWGVYLFKKRCQARKLSLDELRLLDLVWDEVSAMRVTAEDVPLPKDKKIFWIQATPRGNSILADDWADRSGKLYSRPSEGYATLLLAVRN